MKLFPSLTIFQKLQLWSILITFILFSSACKRHCNDASNPDCENYDPCTTVPYVSADFEIGQIFSARINPNADPYKVFIVDSIFPRSCSIMFKAKTEGAKYKWLLGAEIIQSKEFSRVFNEPASSISITLIVEKTLDKCHPDDDGIDTVTKTFKLVDHCDLASVGSYKGLIDNSKDSIVWKLLYVDAQFLKFTSFCGTSHIITTGPINFLEDNSFSDTIFDNFRDEYLITNRQVLLGTKYNGGNLSGIGDCNFKINNDQSVQFSYKNNGTIHTFNGIKIK